MQAFAANINWSDILCSQGIDLSRTLLCRRGRKKQFMNHMNEFTIHRFRGIRDLKLGDLGQINLLIGGNNSGKTSVLEAIALYCDPLNWRRWYEVASEREVSGGVTQLGRTTRLGVADRLIWLFPQDEKLIGGTPAGNPTIELSSSGDFQIEKVIANYEEFFEIRRSRLTRSEEITVDDNDLEIKGIEVSITTSIHHSKDVLFEFDETLKGKLVFSEIQVQPLKSGDKTPTLAIQMISPYSHRLSSLPPQLWTRVVEANLKTATIELLKSFDKNIQDIDIISPTERQLTVSVKHKKLGRAPLSAFGDGLRRVFSFATAIPRVRSGLLLVDELEASIHTRVLEETLSWLVQGCVKNDVQLFTTTHSLEALDAIIDACKNNTIDLVAYRLQKDGDHVTAKRFGKDYLKRLREDLGVDLRW